MKVCRRIAARSELAILTNLVRKPNPCSKKKRAYPASLLLTLYGSDVTTILATTSSDWPSQCAAISSNTNKTFYLSYEAVDGAAMEWYLTALLRARMDTMGTATTCATGVTFTTVMSAMPASILARLKYPVMALIPTAMMMTTAGPRAA